MLLPISLLTFLYLFPLFTSLTTTPIIWKSNPYISTADAQIKTDVTTTFDSSTPISKTFLFPKPYTQLPQIAFALKNYRGSDRLIDQNFHIKMNELTLTSFTLNVTVFGYTNIRIMSVLYMAVDRAFPYHLNVFRDTYVNYGAGPLTNISDSLVGVRSYTNTINYTALATSIASNYTTFGTDLSKNHVAVYITAQQNQAEYQVSPLPQVKFQVTTQIISTDQFMIKVLIEDGYKITALGFGMVVFDVADVQKSKQYTIVFSYSVLDGTVANFIPLPKQFHNSTFIGITDFSAVNPFGGMEFNWEFDPLNNQVIVNKSDPVSQSAANFGLKTYQIAIFYVKTWYCPSSSYYDPVTKVCNVYTCADGDWVIPYENCDDGNMIDFDGCSSTCTIDTGFECREKDKLANGSSLCKYEQNVTLKFERIEESTTSNSFSIFFSLEPASLSNWNLLTVQSLMAKVQIQSIDIPGLVLAPASNIEIKFNSSALTSQIQMFVNLDSLNISNSKLTLTIQPNNTNITSIMHLPSINYEVPITLVNSGKVYSYPADISEFKNSNLVKDFSLFIGFLSLLFMLVGFFTPAGKLIVVEALAVVQMGYFSLIQLDTIPPTYHQLKFLAYSTGYFDMSQAAAESTLSTSVFSILGLNRLIILNYNLTIGLFALPLIVGAVAIAIVKICDLKNVSNEGQKPFKQQKQEENKSGSMSPDHQIDSYVQPEAAANKALTRSEIIISLSKRLMLESGLYGLMICGYLLWTGVFHSAGLHLPENIAVSVVFGIIWLAYLAVFVLNNSSNIDLEQSIPTNYPKQSRLDSGIPSTLTGFGEFCTIKTQISPQSTQSKMLEKIYILMILERPFSSLIITTVSISVNSSPAIILVFFLTLLILINIAYQLGQRSLQAQSKRPLFSYICQNYVLRQSLNFITIVIIQSLLLAYESQRKSSGDEYVLTKSNFTVKALPILLLCFLLVSLMTNLFFWVWEIKNSQLITKGTHLIKILFPKKGQVSETSKQVNMQKSQTNEYTGTQDQKNLRIKDAKKSKLELSMNKQEEDMFSAMNTYVKNSRTYNQMNSPFNGLSQREDTRKSLLEVEKINQQSPKVKDEKSTGYFYEQTIKSFYKNLHNSI